MGWVRNLLMSWKTEFDIRRKEKSFVHGLQHAPDVLNNIPPFENNEISFLHSGHAGDLVHSIPAMYALAKGKKINLYLHLHQPNRNFTKNMKHPNGNVMFTEKTVELFAPLILSQPLFSRCEAWKGQPIHYNLSQFREFPFDYRMGSISRWYFLTFGITWDLGKTWLTVEPDHAYSDAIVVVRTFRYRTPGISYDFLKKYPRLVFLGMPDEYEDMKQHIPQLEYRLVRNFLEMAQVIAGCRLYVGNQSLPSAIAEAVKATRVIELFFRVPTTVVEGPQGYDFVYQPQFEKIVTELMEQPAPSKP